ncbi:TIGR02099 family protein [Sesbania bispinosa]|nr:TIGR02099 family protein [Sesbania bispinosa]
MGDAVAEAAEIDGADVTKVDAAEEVEVAEGEAGLGAEGGGVNGGVGEVGGTVRLNGETLRRGGRKKVEGETTETGAANAFSVTAKLDIVKRSGDSFPPWTSSDPINSFRPVSASCHGTPLCTNNADFEIGQKVLGAK